MDTRDELTVGTAQPPARRGGRLTLPRRRREEHPPTGFDALQKKIRTYNPKGDLKTLGAAYQVALEAHEGQRRLSGEPFIEHPLAVAQILADLRLDTTTLEAALLHDTVEDTTVTLERIQEEFGDDVAEIVDGLTKLDKLQFQTRELAQAENVRKMIVAMAGDIRVLLIKLADRLHNMRTLARVAAGQAAARRDRDPRDLRAAGQPPRRAGGQVGARGPRLQDPASRSVQGDRAARRDTSRRAHPTDPGPDRHAPAEAEGARDQG